MHCVYILETKTPPKRHHVGMTAEPKRRLDEHNSGKSIHTNKFKPRKLSVCVGFSDKTNAIGFEQ